MHNLLRQFLFCILSIQSANLVLSHIYSRAPLQTKNSKDSKALPAPSIIPKPDRQCIIVIRLYKTLNHSKSYICIGWKPGPYINRRKSWAGAAHNFYATFMKLWIRKTVWVFSFRCWLENQITKILEAGLQVTSNVLRHTAAAAAAPAMFKN